MKTKIPRCAIGIGKTLIEKAFLNFMLYINALNCFVLLRETKQINHVKDKTTKRSFVEHHHCRFYKACC